MAFSSYGAGLRTFCWLLREIETCQTNWEIMKQRFEVLCNFSFPISKSIMTIYDRYGKCGFGKWPTDNQVEVRSLTLKIFMNLSIRSPKVSFRTKNFEIKNLAQSILDREKLVFAVDFLPRSQWYPSLDHDSLSSFSTQSITNLLTRSWFEWRYLYS